MNTDLFICPGQNRDLSEQDFPWGKPDYSREGSEEAGPYIPPTDTHTHTQEEIRRETCQKGRDTSGRGVLSGLRKGSRHIMWQKGKGDLEESW